MKFAQGDVWLIDFEPSIGHEYQKKRPAVIVSSNKALAQGRLITVVPMTSSEENTIYDHKIKKDINNNLYKDSVGKVDCLSSFDRSRFIKKLGKLNEEDLASLIHEVRSLFND